MTADILEVDERLSWAQRVGDEVRVQLRVPGTALEPGAAQMRLARGDLRLQVPAEVKAAEGAIVVTFSAPQADLGHDAWHLAIRSSDSGQFVRVQARLLAAATSPVALLSGSPLVTRKPPPAPRTSPSRARRLARRLPAPVRSVLLRLRSARREAVARRTAR